MYLLLLVFLPLVSLAEVVNPVLPPENARVLGLGGAYLAIADDPQAGIHNPAGLRFLDQMGYDQFFGASTNGGVDQLGISYINPSAESGAAFATGFYGEGVTRPGENKYYVPYVGTSWIPAAGFQLGLVTRAAIRTPQEDSLETTWTAVADLSMMHKGRNLSFAGILERAVGGAARMVPRRLRLGGAWSGDSQKWLIAYEWRGTQGLHKYTFRYGSSHLGTEFLVGEYGSLRAGYVWEGFHYYSLGASLGNAAGGWEIEGGWRMRVRGGGSTYWSVGMNYRI
jgi:hypothetical protein